MTILILATVLTWKKLLWPDFFKVLTTARSPHLRAFLLGNSSDWKFYLADVTGKQWAYANALTSA